MEYIMLKDVCDINMGQSPDSSSYNDDGNGLPFFQGNADFGERYPVTRKWCSVPTKIAKPEDILISVRAPIGALNYAREKCCIGRGLAALTPDKSKVSPEFIFWLLKAKNIELNNKGTGSTFKAIGRNVLEETQVPNVPLTVQLEYSQVLERIYAIIQSRKMQLQKLDNLVKARFVELFGEPRSNPFEYPKTMLKNSCKVVTGNTPSRTVAEYYGDYVEWIKTDNIVPGVLNPTKATEYLSEKGMVAGRTVDKGSVLMACIAGSVASIGRVCITDRKVAFNQQINAIIPEKYNTLFLYILLQMSKDYLIEDINMSLKGILSKSKLEGKEFIIPPVELQNQFAAFVTQADKSKAVIQKAVDKAQLLFDSLMQRYFS